MMSEDNVYIRNDRALNTRLDKLEKELKALIALSDRKASQAQTEVDRLKQLWVTTMSGRGSGPTS